MVYTPKRQENGFHSLISSVDPTFVKSVKFVKCTSHIRIPDPGSVRVIFVAFRFHGTLLFALPLLKGEGGEGVFPHQEGPGT